MFVGTHWKAVWLWYKLMLTNFFFFNQDPKTNSPNNRYHCSDPKDVPIVVHTQDWLKAKPDEPPVEGNVASLLTRI
jgi:hypothetical protein